MTHSDAESRRITDAVNTGRCSPTWRAGIGDDKEGPLFRPMTPDATRLIRRHLDRKTPWRLVKNYCRAAGIDPDRLGSRAIGIQSLRKTAINDATRNGPRC